MDTVRREMALLTEVDQPGSAIDQYVEKLDAILRSKMESISELKAKLDRFKEHLKQVGTSGGPSLISVWCKRYGSRPPPPLLIWL